MSKDGCAAEENQNNAENAPANGQANWQKLQNVNNNVGLTLPQLEQTNEALKLRLLQLIRIFCDSQSSK